MGLHGNYRKQTLFLQSVNLLAYFSTMRKFQFETDREKT